MNIKKIILELKEIYAQLKDRFLSEEKINNLDSNKDYYKRLLAITIIDKELLAEEEYFYIDKERLTLLFFTKVVNGLINQFMNDEQKDIISFPVYCSSKDGNIISFL